MTFNWAEYLKVAKELVGIATTPAEREAKLRAAVSRAYYAAFILARNHLRREGHSIPTTGDAHKYVATQFKQSGDSDRQFIGDKLKRLRRYRNQADYVDFFPGLSALTPRAIELSEQVISHLNNL